MKNSVNYLNVLKVTGSFVALLIGSGFATGQEVMQFFSSLGLKGVLAIGITLILLSYLTYVFIKLGMEKGITKIDEVFKYYFGKLLGDGLGWYTLFFIILVFIVMTAGAGSTLEESYGIPKLLGSGMLVILVIVAILRGLEKLTNITGILGPVVIVLTIFIAVASLVKSPDGIIKGDTMIQSLELYTASKNWWSSGILYVGLNILGMASFVPSLGKILRNKREVVYVSILGPGLFGGALVLVSLSILSNIKIVSTSEIPNLALAIGVSPVFKSIFSIIIFISIFASSTSLLWSVVTRFAEEKTKKYKCITLLLGLIGYIGGNIFPFAKLVNLIYPTVGILGTFVLIGVVIKEIVIKVEKKEIKFETD